MEASVKRFKSDAVQGSMPTPFTRLWREKVSAGNLARPRSAEDYARLLDEWGYMVIPLFPSAEQQNAENAAFKQTLETMPEYREPRPELFQGEIHYVKGGFGALGNPSSFHNPFVRDKRRWAMRTMVPIFQALQTLRENTPRKIEQIVDRMRVLRPKATISAETWHRDTTPAKFTHPGDLIYGGWINFDRAGSPPQLLSAFPKSHRQLPLPSMAAKQGFAKANKDEIVELNRLKESILAKTGGKGWFIEVPPGHMLVFRQEMVHEVVGSKGGRKEPAYRLFTAWRVTNSNEKFLSNQFSQDRLDVPRLKSNQFVDMWPQANWKPPAWDNLEVWSQRTFKPTFLEDRQIQTGSHAGESRRVIPRRMYSMNDVAIKLQALDWVTRLQDLNIEIPEIFTDIIQSPPAHWRERWSDQELKDYMIDPDSVYYEPYSEQDKTILRPTVYQ